jgi:hypothetical protein
MNLRPLLPLLLLAACPASPALEVFAETTLAIGLDADEVSGDVVVVLDALTDEDLALVDLGEDWYGRAGLRIELVLHGVDGGRVEVAPGEDAIGISRWSNPALGRRSDRYNDETDRDAAPWGEKFLLVRYLDDGDCEADVPCEVRLPLGIARRRGAAEAVRADVRFGLYDNRGHLGASEREPGLTVAATWAPAN